MPASLAALDVLGPQLEELLKREGIPGLSVTVSVKGERRTFCAGVAMAQRPKPVTAESRFRLGCLIKPLIALVCLRRAAEGRLDLDEPITKRLPSLRAAPGASAITLRHLITHTAGYVEPSEQEARWGYSWEQFDRFFASRVQAFPPGTMWSYTQTGYALLARTLETLDGEDIVEQIRREVFAPLGIDAETGPGGETTALNMFSRRTARFEPILPPRGGGILMKSISDVALRTEDLARIAEAILGAGENADAVVPPAVRAQLTEPVVDIPVSWTTPLCEHAPARYGHGLGLFGAGWGHNGSYVASTACIQTSVEHGVAVVVAMNAWQAKVRDAIAFSILDSICGQPGQSMRAAIGRLTPVAVPQDELAGRYAPLMLGMDAISIDADGRCELKDGLAPTLRIGQAGEVSLEPRTPPVGPLWIGRAEGGRTVLRLGPSLFVRAAATAAAE